jgi:hypothetical protein
MKDFYVNIIIIMTPFICCCRKAELANVFVAMARAAMCDLHWEVKVNALQFWEKVIEQQMSNQGMIDGIFPSVTFSKENRKIVTLTETEIRTRLNKVLEELSRIRCLQVSIIHYAYLIKISLNVDSRKEINS